LIRVALIGAGNHSRSHHAPALARYAADHPELLELSAVCDLEAAKAEAFAEEFGFKSVYTNHRRMIEEQRPDGCVCVMPQDHIAPLAVELMRLGMPVTVEKPPGMTVREAEELAHVAEETGTTHLVSVNRRFQPLVRKGKQWASEHGPARYLRGSMFRDGRLSDTFMHETAIHCVDTLRDLGGEIAVLCPRVLSGTPSWRHAVIEFASGAIGSLEAFPTAGTYEERYEIFGDDYRVEMVVELSPEPRLRCWSRGTLVMDERPPVNQPPCVRDGPYAETEEFVSALSAGRPARPTVAEILPSVKLAHLLAAAGGTDGADGAL
jgi:predicted dehydrogenase